MRAAPFVFASVVVTGMAGLAAAAPCQGVKAPQMDKDGKIVVGTPLRPKGDVASTKIDTCAASLATTGSLTFADTACAAALLLRGGGDKKVPWSMAFKPGDPDAKQCDDAQGNAALSGELGVEEVELADLKGALAAAAGIDRVFSRGQVAEIKLDGTGLTDADVNAATGKLLLASKAQTGTLLAIKLVPKKDSSAAEAYTDEQIADETWCPEPADHSARVCVDLLVNASIFRAPDRNVLAINEGLAVFVRHRSTDQPKVVLTGTRGVSAVTSAPPPRGQSTERAAAPQKAGQPLPRPPVSIARFSPRKPGSADLQVWRNKPEPSEPQATPDVSVDLEVETLTWGSARFGFAGVFGDARAPGWEARLLPGSMQQQIVRSDDASHPNFEVVLGFAPYLLDLWIWGGRSHTGGGRNAYVAPYLGFGLVGQEGKDISALQSIHLGVELEFSPGFSGAVTAVGRRKNRLSDGLTEGSPIEDGRVFLTKTGGWGVATIINFTPEFLSFERKAPPASGSSTSNDGANP